MLSVEELYQTVIKKLTDGAKVVDVSLHLAKITTNEERVAFVYDILLQNNMMPILQKVMKNSEKSIGYRNKGNGYFKAKKDYDALLCYSKAILSAPNNSQELALAYGNRSATLCSLKNYKGAKQDIERALRHNHPDNLKLEKRLGLCERNIKTIPVKDSKIESPDPNKFNMSLETNSHIPCAAGCVSLKHTKEMGRHAIATELIKPGTVIALEKPYITVLLKTFYQTCCYSCLTQSDYLIPCDSCCEVMYCDEECQRSSWNISHKYECPIMTMLIEMSFTKIELLALKTVLKGIYDYGNWKCLQGAIVDANRVYDPLNYGFVATSMPTLNDRSNTEYIFDSKNYLAIHSLATNLENRSVSDIFQKCVTSAIFLHLLLNFTACFSDTDNADILEAKNFIGGLLFYHGMTAPTNMHSITKIHRSREGECISDTGIGSGAYAFLSMLNHSCAPNVVRFSTGTTMALVVLRPVKAGSQLLDNYGFHHSIHSKSKRQESLKFQYKFDCKCEACVGRWPMYMSLQPATNLSKEQRQTLSLCKMSDSTLDALKLGDRQLALEYCDSLCACLYLLDEKAPCLELAGYQETFKQCWSLFQGVLPYRDSEILVLDGLD